jgi:hypothetical protein
VLSTDDPGELETIMHSRPTKASASHWATPHTMERRRRWLINAVIAVIAAGS